MGRTRGPISQIAALLRDLSFDSLNAIHYWRHNLTGNKVQKNYFSGTSKYPPVILVQGFMGTRGVLQPLENYLRSVGHDVISVDLGVFNISDIRRSAEILGYKIERILEKFGHIHGFKKVHIIGHSMGGLIGLYYVKKLGGHRVVEKLIAMGTPFHGTWTSLIGLFPLGLFSRGIWQMLPKSSFLKSLLKRNPLSEETEIISICAKFDTICPPKSCHLNGAENETLVVGHAGLLMDSAVFESVSTHLQQTALVRRDFKVVPLKRR